LELPVDFLKPISRIHCLSVLFPQLLEYYIEFIVQFVHVIIQSKINFIIYTPLFQSGNSILYSHELVFHRTAPPASTASSITPFTPPNQQKKSNRSSQSKASSSSDQVNSRILSSTSLFLPAFAFSHSPQPSPPPSRFLLATQRKITRINIRFFSPPPAEQHSNPRFVSSKQGPTAPFHSLAPSFTDPVRLFQPQADPSLQHNHGFASPGSPAALVSPTRISYPPPPTAL
jgi:hypothetical protein